MREFFKRNWLGLLGLLVGLISLILSFIFYTQTLVYREPVFVVDPNRTEIIRADRISNAPLKVVRLEGDEISGDISSARVYLWNRGTLAVKPEHILLPLRLTLGDPQGEILDFQILKISRGIVAPNIIRYSKDTKRTLSVNFKILEQNDGFCVQIIYVGKPFAEFTIDGQIEGVPYHIGSSQVEGSRFWFVYFDKAKKFGLVLITIFVLFVAIVIFTKIVEYIERATGKAYVFLVAFLVWSKTIGSLAIMAFLIFWVLILNPIRDAKKEAKLSLVESVPSSIVPIQGKNETPNE